MKASKLALNLALALVATIGSLFVAQEAKAGACYIYISAPCKDRNVKALTWFNDGELLARVNATRCIQRAAEYYNYCVSSMTPGMVVTSAYQVVPGTTEISGVKGASASYVVSGAVKATYQSLAK